MLLIGGKMVDPTETGFTSKWPTQCTPENPSQLTLNKKCYRVRDVGKGEGALAGVAHTIHGNVAVPQTLLPGAGPANREYLVVKNWNRGAVAKPKPRVASSHLVVGYDGHIVSPLDLVVNASYSVGTYPKGSTKLADSINGWTISVEMCQTDKDKGWRLYQATVDATAAILDWCATRFSWPKVFPGKPDGTWVSAKFPRAVLLSTRGLFGHCNVANADRGAGDPGKFVFNVLYKDYGWKPVLG